MSSSNRKYILVAIGILPLLFWPAFVNGYPLLFPDSIDYLAQGRPVLYALLHWHHPSFTGMRSALYSLFLLPFHGNVTPWPILLFHATIVTYALYLTVRSLFPRYAIGRTALLLAALALGTSLSWYICLLMPDILGAPLYLSLYLLIFARKTLSRGELKLVCGIVAVGVVAHSSHLLLAYLLVGFLAVLRLFRWPPMLGRAAELRFAGFVLLGATLLQLAVNTKLTGHVQLNANRPPYLEARIISDGPGRNYLLQNCVGHPDWLLCQRFSQLGNNDDEFLWAPGYIWSSATPAEQAELRREEFPLAVRTLVHNTRELFSASAANFTRQVVLFGVDDFDNNTYLQTNLDSVLPNSRAHYDRTLQAANEVPSTAFSLVQTILVAASLCVVILLVSVIYRRRNVRLLGLFAVVIFILIANAFLSGVLSEVDARYQARVVWLLPMLAILFLLDYRDGMRNLETY